MRIVRRRRTLYIKTSDYRDIAWISWELRGPGCEVRFPGRHTEDQCLRIVLRLGLLGFGLAIPCKPFARFPTEIGQDPPTFGFSVFDGVVLCYWNTFRGGFDLPWTWRPVGEMRKGAITTYPRAVYHLPLSQQRVVDVSVSEMDMWRPWIPWRRVSRALDVSFDQETGENVGTWKGGVLMSHHPMPPGVSVDRAIRDAYPRLELGLSQDHDVFGPHSSHATVTRNLKWSSGDDT